MSSRPSSAIKIVAPNAPSPSLTPSPDPGGRPRKAESQRQCRNVLIHGFCKYEGKGCMYQHPARPDSQNSSNGSVINVNAPVFVPKSSSALSPQPVEADPEITSDFDPPETFSQLALGMNDYSDGYESGRNDYTGMYSAPKLAEVSYTPPPLAAPVEIEEYYQDPVPAVSAQHAYIRRPLEYHLYVQPKDIDHPLAKHFISPKLHEELTKRSEAMYYTPPSLNHSGMIPDEVSGYHSLVPIDSMEQKVGSWTMRVWRGVKAETGEVLALRRIENFRLPHENAFQSVASWRKLRSTNIVNLREAFTTRAWGDNSLVLVYEYYPTAKTLADVHFRSQAEHSSPSKRFQRSPHNGIEERTLWSYIIQLACGIKTIHDAGLAVRTFGSGSGNEIWITGENRVRIGGVGMWDVLDYDPVRHTGTTAEITYMQQEDLLAFGKLILSMASPPQSQQHNVNPSSFTFPKMLEGMTRHYSNDVKNVVMWCLSKPSPHKVIAQFFDMIGSRILGELDAMQLRGDMLENSLFSELENARLIRLMAKFGFINERPEFDHDSRWSETGDRYVLKLFRDYVFHQIDEEGRPVINLGHVLTCLNKLDVGSEEKIMLVSRDEQSCLIVSYKEIKACFEGAFRDLSKR